MNFTCLLLSCCLASLPETITFFYFTLIFQEENLPRGNAGCLGCLRHRVCDPRTPRLPWKLREEGRAALPPRSAQIWDKGNNSILQVNESYSSSHRAACTRQCFQRLGADRDAHVGVVANYRSWYVPGVTPICYRQQNAPQHAATRLHLRQERGRNADARARRGHGA